ncbi:hypothetical protein ABIA35_005990 [Catenulispora sp. MAP12-49]|uniref:hypothetical protein n=1 Tax=Catenulispora sp. MAP12-49 TaxID=3156302 RepID=UPI00351923B6
MRSNLIARAGLASAPMTAFAPLAGAALTGHGVPWLLLPVGSMVAFVGGTCAERRTASARRRGFIVADPAPDADGVVCATAPRDLVGVEFTWVDEAA